MTSPLLTTYSRHLQHGLGYQDKYRTVHQHAPRFAGSNLDTRDPQDTADSHKDALAHLTTLFQIDSRIPCQTEAFSKDAYKRGWLFAITRLFDPTLCAFFRTTARGRAEDLLIEAL